MKIILRQAEKSDAVPLVEFSESIFRSTFSQGNIAADIDMYCRQNFSIEIQEQEILSSNIVTFLAEIESTLVGFAQLRLKSSVDCIKASDPSELHRLYVSSKHHGSGLAHHLIQKVLDTASNADKEMIWLGVWEHNPRAIKFYQKYGFNMVGEHIFMLGRDPQRDLIMAADVKSSYLTNRITQ